MNKKSAARELAQECIFTALIELMKQKAYEEITITEIVKKAGFSRMAFYRNYETKNDILVTRLDQILDPLMEEIRTNPSLSSREFWQLIFYGCREQRKNLKCMIDAGLLDILWNRHKLYLGAILRDYIKCDMTSEENRMRMNYQMGGFLNMILYVIENEDANIDLLVSVMEDSFRFKIDER